MTEESKTQNPKPKTLLFVLGGFFVLALIYNFTIPLGKGPDEPDHYAYVKWLVNHRSLPPINDRDMMREKTTGAIAMHPPLAHVIHAVWFTLFQWLPDEASQHLLRAWSAVLCAMTLLVAFRLTQEMFPDDRVLPLAVTAFIAFLPHFQLIASAISTDPLLVLLNSLLLGQFVRTMRIADCGLRIADFGKLGTLYGIVLITKSSALAFAPLGAVVAAAGWKRVNGSTRQRVNGLGRWLKNAAAFYLPVFVIASWWFIRFHNVTGRWHPINPKYHGHETFDRFISRSLMDFLTRRDAPVLFWRHVEGVFTSVWGQVDWSYPTLEAMGVRQAGVAAYPLTVALLRLFTVLTIVAVVGLVVLVVRSVRQNKGGHGVSALLFAAAHFTLIYFALMHYTLFVHPGGYQAGRYLYPSVCAFGTLFIAGLMTPCPEAERVRATAALTALLLLWNAACLINLKWFLIPFYGHG